MPDLKKITSATTLSLLTVFGAAGCATVPRPLHLQRAQSAENTSLFSSQNSLEQRVQDAALADGMSKEQVFAALKIDIHKFKALSGHDLMDAAYAGANPTPQTEAAMRAIMDLVNRTEVYRLNYRDIGSVTGLGLDLSAQTKTRGFDRQLTLIFVDGQLRNAKKVLSGDPSIDLTNTTHIWDLISGAAPSAASDGVRAVVPHP